MMVVLPEPRKPVIIVTGIFSVCRTPVPHRNRRAGWVYGGEPRSLWVQRPQVASGHPARRVVNGLAAGFLACGSLLRAAFPVSQWLVRRSAIHTQLRGQLRLGADLVARSVFPINPHF